MEQIQDNSDEQIGTNDRALVSLDKLPENSSIDAKQLKEV